MQQTQRLGVLSLGVTRDNSNSLLSPTRGSIIRLETRFSGPVVLSDSGLQFTKLLGDASRYIGAGVGNVLAMRLRGGTFIGRSVGSATNFIPPQERLYAGGPTTVRGYNQNELGSLLYISRTYQKIFVSEASNPTTGGRDTVWNVHDTAYRRVVPVGGNALIVGNLELRLRSPFRPTLQWTPLLTPERCGTGRRLRIEPRQVQGHARDSDHGFLAGGSGAAAIGYNPYRRPPGRFTTRPTTRAVSSFASRET